jgi:hypothetical protein
MYLLLSMQVTFDNLGDAHLTQHLTEDLTSKVIVQLDGVLLAGMLSLSLLLAGFLCGE